MTGEDTWAKTPMTHAAGEHRGWCKACIADMKAGGEHPVCKSADPADVAFPGARLCAWCGHGLVPA